MTVEGLGSLLNPNVYHYTLQGPFINRRVREEIATVKCELLRSSLNPNP